MAGFIYILSNPSMPGLVKIGKTTRAPEFRARELGSGSGIPVEFKLEFAIYTRSVDIAEADIHSMLKSSRYADGREFFRLSVADAVQAVSSYVLAVHGLEAGYHDFVPLKNDILEVSEKSGVFWCQIVQVLKFISVDAWQSAHDKWESSRAKKIY